MKEKKLEWAKPVLRDLGAVLTDGKGVAGSCSPGSIYNIDENCGNGTAAVSTCSSGTGVGTV